MVNQKPNVRLLVQNLSHRFGLKKILFQVNLRVYEAQVLALVGPSGCGKSTLLNAIIGTLKPTEGAVLMAAGGGLTAVKGPGRDRGIVYQRYALYPFLTALQNVAFGLMVDESSLPYRLLLYPRWRRMQQRHLAEATALLEKLGLGKALHLYPQEMSGGMCQRVAVAQALITKPSILLLDEPFGALDEATREELQWMLRGLARENRECVARGASPPYSIIIVTHEINEALFVSDRLVGLSQYWGWEDEGFSECPGATIIYDQPSPIYELKEHRDLDLFKEQKRRVLECVFDAGISQERRMYVQESERFPVEKGGDLGQ